MVSWVKVRYVIVTLKLIATKKLTKFWVRTALISSTKLFFWNLQQVSSWPGSLQVSTWEVKIHLCQHLVMVMELWNSCEMSCHFNGQKAFFEAVQTCICPFETQVETISSSSPARLGLSTSWKNSQCQGQPSIPASHQIAQIRTKAPPRLASP